jgi:hypothetical protein
LDVQEGQGGVRNLVGEFEGGVEVAHKVDEGLKFAQGAGPEANAVINEALEQ